MIKQKENSCEGCNFLYTTDDVEPGTAPDPDSLRCLKSAVTKFSNKDCKSWEPYVPTDAEDEDAEYAEYDENIPF